MLHHLETLVKDCTKCALHKNRNMVVFGEGNPRPKLVLIGEGPGEEEDLSGHPFVGPAGQQLDKILKFIEVPREETYILNPVLCRPPNNRNPLIEEIEACKPRLVLQLCLLKPKLIVCLGRIATTAILGQFNGPLKQFFDKGFHFEPTNSLVKVTMHPSALLRNNGFKRQVIPHWQEIKTLYKGQNK